MAFWLRMVSIDDGGLAGLAVADDQLALAAADRDQGVDRLQAGLHRLVHRLARDDARRLDVDAAALGRLDRALAVDRLAQRVDDPAQQALADRHVDDRLGALTSSPSEIARSSPKITTPTLSLSRFRAMPFDAGLGNSTISPAWTLSRP